MPTSKPLTPGARVAAAAAFVAAGTAVAIVMILNGHGVTLGPLAAFTLGAVCGVAIATHELADPRDSENDLIDDVLDLRRAGTVDNTEATALITAIRSGTRQW